jgi:hypothetical protein
MTPWQLIEAEAADAYRGDGRFPIRAYSEFMPPPYVGIKPYAPTRAANAATNTASGDDAIDVDEYEQAQQLDPGIDHLASRLVDVLGKLVRGQPHGLSRTLLADNPAWPAELADAARAGKLGHDPIVAICAIALSRSQDDKGNDRWTLFGASHDGAAAAFWHGLDEARLAALLAWAGRPAQRADWCIVDDPHVPAHLRHRVLAGMLPATARTVVALRPFAELPADVRAGYLDGRIALVPTPAALVFHHHTGYRALAGELPRATQIPLLHVFPRVESAYAVRIPQSGWLDEIDPATSGNNHKVVSSIQRTHRWQRVARDADIELHGDGKYTDKVSVALFGTTPEAIDLYDKPLARNAQIWTHDYHLVLDGPRADKDQIARAAAIVDAGGRFGYRMYYPAMRAGLRELYWHVPVVARPGSRFAGAPLGYVSAERDGADRIVLRPRLLARGPHVAAARLFDRDPGHARHTVCNNVRKLLEAVELAGAAIPRSYARALVHIPHQMTLDAWLDQLPARAADRGAGARLVDDLRACLTADPAPAPARVLDGLASRDLEEHVWSSIAGLAHGAYRQKNDADGIAVNTGKRGGPAAEKADVHVAERRDLEALGDHLHARHAALIARHGMIGKADVVDHVFQWQTDFAFPWMEGWAKNQRAPSQRNIVVRIPGRNRHEAVIMADHYDTAYMEDVFYAEHGGDALRAAACGADDNHSATTALLVACDRLLALARDGQLIRDVWLVHLTGEEFPADSLGARALAQGLVERSLTFRAIGTNAAIPVGDVRVTGIYVLDMIGHNADRERDVFQIAPGEGAGSARLARFAHRANEAWNRLAVERNQAAPRHDAGRAKRMPDVGPDVPPPPLFAHLPLHGEVRTEWEPRSALFNTDGQVLSDLGIPVVLFMENYDISRKGYHDTHDTMENIDLDYCAALTAIAVETVALAASEA